MIRINGFKFSQGISLSFKTILVALLLVFFAPFDTANAQLVSSARVEISKTDQRYAIIPHAYLTKDPQRKISYKDVIERHLNNFRGARDENAIINLNGSPTWILFSVTNSSNEEEWLLDFGSVFDGRMSFISQIMVRDHTHEKTFFKRIGQNNKSNDSISTIGRSIRIDIPKQKASLIAIYMEPEAGFSGTIRPSLISEQHYHGQLQISSIFFGIYITIIIAAGGFFIALYVIRKKYFYLLFASFFILQAFTFTTLNNNIIAAFPANFQTISLCLYLAIICGIFGSKNFLRVGQDNDEQSLPFYALSAIALVGALVSLLKLGSESVLLIILFALPILTIKITLALLSYIHGQLGKYGGHYLAIGWFIGFMGMLITFLSSLNLFVLSEISLNAYWVAVPIQLFLFAMAAQQKINLETQDQRQDELRETRAERSLARLKQSKESADQARLLRVIEREREVMTELREREMQRSEEMRIAKDAADEANSAKSAFLAVVSHEIRTPMTGIMGMVRFLLDTNLNDQQNEYTQAIQDSGETMLALLNDILDFEKIESANLDLENIDFDLPKVVNGIVTLMSGHAKDKNINLSASFTGDIPQFVKGDPTRLRQVILNLVNNALKFTEHGDVTIRIKGTELKNQINKSSDKDYEIYFGVQDTGIGISEEAQEKLFSPFAQAESSTTRKYGGTGLGLAICKRLVEAMGSGIAVESKEGKGSLFHFSLLMDEGKLDMTDNVSVSDKAPIASPKIDTQAVKPSKPKPPAPPAPASQLKPAMVILIIEDNEMNQRVLSGLLEKEGHQTIIASSGEEGLEKLKSHTVDLIFSDVQMPGMDGIETTIAIRTLEDTKKASTPVIALTGNVMPDDVQRYYAANMNGFLPKPIDPDLLIKILINATEKQFDNPIDLGAIKNDLSDEDTAAEENTPDDHILQEQPKNLSQETDRIDQQSPQEAIQAKPQEDINTMRTGLDLEENDRFNITEIDPDIFDEVMLKNLLDNLGKEQLTSLVHGFLDKSDQIVVEINKAKHDNDFQTMLDRAHELKGMAGNFGMTALSKQAEDIERYIKVQENETALGICEGLPDINLISKQTLNLWLSQSS